MKFLSKATLIAIFAILSPLYAASDSGKAIYDQSCIHCHGASGQGNPVMDTFYRMKLPRLNAARIQEMSDADLTNVILNGKRKMPAAMAGLPDNQHRTKIKPEQVPDLIAFIRTLRGK